MQRFFNSKLCGNFSLRLGVSAFILIFFRTLMFALSIFMSNILSKLK
jgi:hypothetical protein